MNTTVSTYEQQALDFAASHNLTLAVGKSEYKKHFSTDDSERWVYSLRLSRKGYGFYSFKFGQSIAAGRKDPTMYDVLACLQKYDVGSFEDFLSEFGYNSDSIKDRRNAMKTYNAVCAEYEALSQMFTAEEMVELQEIN